jgi:hypothetical protein
MVDEGHSLGGPFISMAIVAVGLVQGRGRAGVILTPHRLSQEGDRPMLDIAVTVCIGKGQSLPPMAGSAPEILHRVSVENLLIRMGGPRLLHLLQPGPVDSQVTCGATIDEVQIFHPELLNPLGELGGSHIPDLLRHNQLELGLVVLPLRGRIHEHGRDSSAKRQDGNSKQEGNFFTPDPLNHLLVSPRLKT